MRTSAALAGLIALALAAGAGAETVPAGEEAEPRVLLERLRSAEIDDAEVRAIHGLRLDTGVAVLDLQEGLLFPATAPGLGVTEMVFLGHGRLELAAPDTIEAGQLELFTGRRSLAEPFDQAVIVIGRDRAAERLLAQPHASELDPDRLEAARARFAAWRGSPERRHVGAEAALLLDALGEPPSENYSMAWFRSLRLGELLLLVEPDAEEQITLGQFVPLETSERQERRLGRILHREQRRGRLLGLRLDDLGVWDTWLSTPLRSAQGVPQAGTAAFEPRHYEIEVELAPKAGELEGRARLELHAVATGRRVVEIGLHTDLELREVRGPGGEELFTLRSGDRFHAFLPEVAEPGERFVLEIAWGGRFFDRGEGRSWALRDGLAWHPRAGTIDRASYEVTLRWPKRFELVASGRLVDGGIEGRERWQRRRLDRPSVGFGFEIGRFELRTLEHGGHRITAAIDPEARKLTGDLLDEILTTAADALGLYESAFGPHVYGDLHLVTVPRTYSQSLPGLVTLSHWMMLDLGTVGNVLGLEDRRTVIAHEVAHQWWGHRVGWRGYRDQWLSEALANYSAMLWARRRLSDAERLGGGPTAGWQQALTAELGNGRWLESLGPVVLGQRLISSRGARAYETIVYQKGALVIEMIALTLGEEVFRKSLRELAELAADQPISTEDFLEFMGRSHGVDLGGLAHHFIYGTGLPEVDYRYRFEKLESGRHRIVLEVLTRLGRRTHLGDWYMVAPLQILVRQGESTLLTTRPILLRGAQTRIELETELEPQRLWLDLYREVYGLFVDCGGEDPPEGRCRIWAAP